MIPGLRIEQKALEDIKRHFEYLREYNPDRAKRFVLALEATCSEMVQAPLLGSPPIL